MNSALQLSLLWMVFVLAWTCRAEEIFRSDFGSAAVAIKEPAAAAPGKVSGVLPPRWREDSSPWAKVDAACEPAEQDGVRYLRITAKEIGSGQLQFCTLPVPALAADESYRLQVKLRSGTRTPVLFGIRTAGAPFAMLWKEQLTPQESWQEKELDFTVKDAGKPLGLWMILTTPGTVDIATISLEKRKMSAAGAGAPPTGTAGTAGDPSAAGNPEGQTNSSTIAFDTDFGAADVPITDMSGAATEKVRGVLPKQWREDSSSWAQLKVVCEPGEVDGQRYLRLDVQELQSGALQINTKALPQLGADVLLRLTIKARSATGAPVTYGVRMVGAPYEFLWKNSLNLSSNWQELRHDFSLKKNGGQHGFWFNVTGKGTVDIRRIRLEVISRTALLNELRQKYPAGSPANILGQTGLPLGLQSGWYLGNSFSQGDEVIIRPDAGVPDASGRPALFLQSEKEFWLRSAPLPILFAAVPHRYSLAVRGQGKWTFSIVAPGGLGIPAGLPLAGRTVELKNDADWVRVAVDFSPMLGENKSCLQISGAGKLWIADFQCGPVEKAKAFEPGFSAEVALAAPASSAAGNIQFSDEPARVAYFLSGDLAGARLRLKAVNVYGEERELPAVSCGESRRGEIAYDVFPDRPLGSFRIEAQIEKDGKAWSGWNEIVMHRMERPRYWGKDAPDSPFGIHMNASRERISAMKAAGINWTRLHDAGMTYICWRYLEPEQGKWQFRDEAIARYRASHIKILGQLGTAPKWASYFRDQKPHDWYWDTYYLPLRMEDFKNYVHTVTQRYKGMINDYFVWNEPWVHAWLGVSYDEKKSGMAGYVTSEDPQKSFANLQAAAYQTAKSVSPDIRILGFNTNKNEKGDPAFYRSGKEWTAGVLANGGDQTCDIMDYHSYSGFCGYPGDSNESGFQTAFQPVMQKYAGVLPKPVWMTEGMSTGCPNREGMYKHTLPFPNSDDIWTSSDQLCRYELSLLQAGVAKFFLYSAHADNGFGVYGLNALVCEDGSVHPSAAAQSHFSWLLEDLKPVRHSSPARGIHVYVFAGAGRSVAVISSEQNHAEYTIPFPAGVRATDLFGNRLQPGVKFKGTLIYLEMAGENTFADSLFAPQTPAEAGK